MGIDKDNSKEVFNLAEAKAHKALADAALLVQRTAKQLVPVDTGTLKRSITHEFRGKHTVAVGSNVEYAPYVELGTSKMSARPYLRPALEANRREIRRLLKQK